MKNNLIYYVLAFVCLISVLYSVSIQPKVDKTLGSNITLPLQQAFSTSTQITVTTASTLVFATSSLSYMAISNGGPQSVWLNFTGNAATLNKGILLTASTTYVLNQDQGNAYYGAVFGIAAGTASNILTVTGF